MDGFSSFGMKIKLMIKNVLISISLAGMLSCSSLQNMFSNYAPILSLKNANIGGIDFNGVDLLFTYELKNRVNFGTTMNRLKFDLTADDKLVTSVDSPQNITIPPSGTASFDLKHRIKYVDFAENIIGLFKKDDFTAKVKGNVGVLINQTIGSVNVPLSAQKKVGIPKIPEIKFGSFDFKSQNLVSWNPSATFNLNLKVLNKNSFATNLNALNYNFSAAGYNVANGAARNVSLPAGKESALSIPITLKGKELVSMIPKLRDFRNNGGYKLKGNVDLGMIGSNVKIPYDLP